MTYRLEIHIFGASKGEFKPEVQFWEKRNQGQDCNPLLLKYQNDELNVHYFFSLRRIKNDVALYWPFATHADLPWVKELPRYGFEKVVV